MRVKVSRVQIQVTPGGQLSSFPLKMTVKKKCDSLDDASGYGFQNWRVS